MHPPAGSPPLQVSWQRAAGGEPAPQGQKEEAGQYQRCPQAYEYLTRSSHDAPHLGRRLGALADEIEHFADGSQAGGGFAGRRAAAGAEAAEEALGVEVFSLGDSQVALSPGP